MKIRKRNWWNTIICIQKIQIFKSLTLFQHSQEHFHWSFSCASVDVGLTPDVLPFPHLILTYSPSTSPSQCFHLHFWIYSFAISPATSISEAITISHWTATVVCLLLSDPFEAHIWFNLFNDFSLLREWHGIPQVSTDSAWLCCSLPSSAPFLPMVLSAQLWGIAFWLFSNSLWPLPI